MPRADGRANACRWIALAAVAICSVSPATAASIATHRPDPVILPTNAFVHFESARTTVSRIETKDPAPSPSDPTNLGGREPAAAALEFVSVNRKLFRLVNPPAELKVIDVKRDELGFHHVRFTQQFHELEIANTDLLFHYNREGVLYLVTANYIPTPTETELQPKLDRPAAIRAAAADVSTEPADWAATLKIWPTPSGIGILAYEVAASVAPDKAWRVFVDAHTGRILDRISTIYTASPTTPR